MTIQRLPDDTAKAATNALRFALPLDEVAVRLFRWQNDLAGPLLPASFPIPKPVGSELDAVPDATYYQRQARLIRDTI